MTTYTAITAGQIDAESPLDTTLAAQWTNNALAMFEGDASASGVRLQYAALASDVGPWHTIATASPSAVADVQFIDGVGGVVFDSTYDEYRLLVDRLIPATDSVRLFFQVTEDGGSSWVATSHYLQCDGTGPNQQWQSDSAGFIGNLSTEGITFEMILKSPSIGNKLDQLMTVVRNVSYDTTGTRDYGIGDGAKGGYLNGNAYDGIKAYFSVGNIASGTITLQGRRI